MYSKIEMTLKQADLVWDQDVAREQIIVGETDTRLQSLCELLDSVQAFLHPGKVKG